MFKNKHFYHATTRKAIAAFGTLFNDLIISHNDGANNLTQYPVPLSYGPKSKFLARIRNYQVDSDKTIAIKLPRMSFEINSFFYNSARKPQRNTQRTLSSTNTDNKRRTYGPVPYQLGIQLNIYTKQQDDALQIVEQIIPYFQPQLTLTLKDLEDSILSDVNFRLDSVTPSDDYEGGFDSTNRTIIYTLDFMASINYYGPIEEQGVIKSSTMNFGVIEADGNTRYEAATATVNPIDAREDEPHIIDINWNILNEF